MANITYLNNKPEHDAAVSAADKTPTVIYLSNSPLPVCKAFTPKYEDLAAKYAERNVDINFCLMELSSETSPMFKFAPNQLPVLVLMVKGMWCRTIMGANVRELEAGIEELLKEAAKWLR